jgi:hypothetical protein
LSILSLLAAAALVATADAPREVPRLAAVPAAKPPLIDGRLDDPAWQNTPGTDRFTQFFPFDGAPPSEQTNMRVLYDATALYIGFDCQQTHTPIVERLTRRDRDSESEWVWIAVDSRNDGKSAFVFAVNISGVQADGQIIDQTTYSWEWDEHWEAKTARTPTGWSAELRIPVRALRFDGRAPVQSWGFQATRFIAQRQETVMWAYYPRDVATPLTYLGRLEEMRGLKGAGALELLPFAAAYARRRDAIENTRGSDFHLGGTAGLDLKWHVAHDLTLDAAFNPDFAQVEADQVILNLTNFETFFPEKRPFFLEGIEAFSFPLSVFYSRRIGSAPPVPAGATGDQQIDLPLPATIYGAGKLVGRLGPRWTLGALSALTAPNRITVETAGAAGNVAAVERLAAPATAFNVLRLKHELGWGHIGVIGTAATAFERNGNYAVAPDPTMQVCPAAVTTAAGGRCFHDAYLAGADARWRSPAAEYVVSGAFVQSYIAKGVIAAEPDGTMIGPGATAPGGWLRIAKEGGKHVIWSAEYSGLGRKLQYNDVGYMARQNLHAYKASFGWRTLEAGAHTIETTSTIDAAGNWNFDGLDLGQLYSLTTRLRLRNFSSVFLAADAGPARYDDREVGDGTALERAGYLGGRIELGTDPRGSFAATLTNQSQLIAGGSYATSLQVDLVVHALPQLDIGLLPQITWSAGEFRHAHEVSTDVDAFFGKLAAKSVSATLRVSYTFTPQLTLQTYMQAFLAAGHYTDLRLLPTVPGSKVSLAALQAAPTVSPPQSPDFEQAAINVNVVVRWEYRLGSTIYLVYTRSQQPNVANFTTPATLTTTAFSHGAAADVILLKFSYWWAS